MTALDLVREEPVAVAGVVRLVILAAVAFGLGWTSDQIAAVMAAAEAVLTLLARSQVTPTSRLS